MKIKIYNKNVIMHVFSFKRLTQIYKFFREALIYLKFSEVE